MKQRSVRPLTGRNRLFSGRDQVFPDGAARLHAPALVVHKDLAQLADRDGGRGEALESITRGVSGEDLGGVSALMVVHENNVMPFDGSADRHDAFPSRFRGAANTANAADSHRVYGPGTAAPRM